MRFILLSGRCMSKGLPARARQPQEMSAGAAYQRPVSTARLALHLQERARDGALPHRQHQVDGRSQGGAPGGFQTGLVFGVVPLDGFTERIEP